MSNDQCRELYHTNLILVTTANDVTIIKMPDMAMTFNTTIAVSHSTPPSIRRKASILHFAGTAEKNIYVENDTQLNQESIAVNE